MSSEDVIELGSSDDEAEPAPKKKKPMPNAMVHIPTKLPGVTIKPTKSNLPTIKNLTIKSNPMVLIKPSAGHVGIPINKNYLKNAKSVSQIQNQKVSINPLCLAKSLGKRQIVVKKTSSNKKPDMQGAKVLNSLPPGITVKPVQKKGLIIKPVLKAGRSGTKIRLQTIVPNKAAEVPTVELDDEDVIESSTSSPQWYLRPEDQNLEDKVKEDEEAKMEVDEEEQLMEVQNNKEPETKQLVEITIEDSPIKPIYTKHKDVGKELTITIEDSPVKNITKSTKEFESDNESNDVTDETVPHSRKKLEYQKSSKRDKRDKRDQVEIEIDMQVTDYSRDLDNDGNLEPPTEKSNEGNEKAQKCHTETDKLNQLDVPVLEESTKVSEFHPVYQEFIDICFKLENSKDMEKIVEKKIKAYYKQCCKEYVESEEFIDLVSSKIVSMKASPEKMYLYIKDIVDELNLQRKMTKSIIPSKEVEIVSQYEETRYDSKKRRQIRKLEKTIKKLHRAIQKLEEQEVDFDDDEDSVYLLTERYKERMVRVHSKFCQLTNTKMPSEPRIHIEARPGRPSGPAKKLEKWINRKVPIGTPLPFPDFHDVLRFVKEANDDEKLGWTEFEIMEEARDLFTRCGKKLQRRRQENEWRIAASRICTNPDPAEDSVDLKQKLDENKLVAAKKETELLNKYVDRQNQLKLEAEEIGDKEAEESPIESEDEEEAVDISNSMENKQKRKERLKRLLQEKNKKEEDKENSAIKVPEGNGNKHIEEGDSKENKPEKELVTNVDKEKLNNSELDIETHSTEIETMDDKEIECENEVQQSDTEKIDSDTDKVESDVEEMHLLQKLHSENEANTSTQDSDSDTPIAISDTLESDSEMDNGTEQLCDVISIEDSSYSESECIIDEMFTDNDNNSLNKQSLDRVLSDKIEIEYSSEGIEGSNTEKTPDRLENIAVEVEENILLATSDEEETNKTENLVSEDTCINLKDDNISISETMIDGRSFEEKSVYNNENATEDTNYTLEIAEESVNGDGQECTDKNDQKKLEEITNLSDILEECQKDDVINSDDSTKDIVDIRSTSDVNSVESTELSSDFDNKNKESIAHNKNLNEIESVEEDKFNNLISNSTQKDNIFLT